RDPASRSRRFLGLENGSLAVPSAACAVIYLYGRISTQKTLPKHLRCLPYTDRKVPDLADSGSPRQFVRVQMPQSARHKPANAPNRSLKVQQKSWLNDLVDH